MSEREATVRPCTGWINLDGIVAKCPELNDRGKRALYHSEKCAHTTGFYQRAGLSIGSPVRRPAKPKACSGWATQQDESPELAQWKTGTIVECGKVFTPDRASGKYHSEECARFTKYLRERNLELGESYVWHAILKPPALPEGLCAEWVIRDHVIQECGRPFLPGQAHRKYCDEHLLTNNAQSWIDAGYELGDSVEKNCDYRKCGRRFDRIRKEKNGTYCCRSHGQMERLARKLDEGKVRRPDDWVSKPEDWRVIGTELLSREDHVSNRELAEKFQKYFARYGVSPLQIVANQQFKKLVNRVRKWVNRPGKQFRAA